MITEKQDPQLQELNEIWQKLTAEGRAEVLDTALMIRAEEEAAEAEDQAIADTLD